MILPHSKVFRTLEETFAATNFTTKPIHEWTKWPSAIGWLARGLADVHLRSLIFMTLACTRRKWCVVRIVAKQLKFIAQLADRQSRFCSETCTDLTSKLQLTDGLLTDQLTKRSRNRPWV